jgi:hypothetical protein
MTVNDELEWYLIKRQLPIYGAIPEFVWKGKRKVYSIGNRATCNKQ